MRMVYIVLSCFMFCACNQDSPAPSPVFGSDISSSGFSNALSLTDHTGNVRHLADFKGKVVALFFGYTHCPDVCPTTLSELAQAMKLLGKRNVETQVLFVTLDPERDTQQVLAKFVPFFNSRFIGLYGTSEQIAEAAKNFKVYFAKQEVTEKSGYSIDHSAGIYLFDKSGKIRIYLKYGQSAEEIAHDIGTLL
ncbi:MAG: SCO family protein [Methylophilaceae bacterium]|nr:SCO family protein [Methylophilaceae bacterium]